MEEVTLPTPPDGFEYKLVKKRIQREPTESRSYSVRNKDPSELTPRQLATLKYREKNRHKISEYLRTYYNKKKEEKSF
jgi:hypothetical protein